MAVAAICLLSAAEVARTLTSPQVGARAGWYVALFVPFFLLFTVILWHPTLPRLVLCPYMLFQSVLILALLSLHPEMDFITGLFVFLSYQAALVFTGRARWFWICALALLVPASLMILLNPLKGLALGLAPMAFAWALPAYVVVDQQLEKARVQSQALLGELQERHRQLEAYAVQAAELAALEERNRLARDLHDSVSQSLFSVILNTRSAQILLERDPARVRPQLEQLQTLTQNALAEMRGLIAKRRPQSD